MKYTEYATIHNLKPALMWGLALALPFANSIPLARLIVKHYFSFPLNYFLGVLTMKKAELTPEQREINKQKNAPIVARIEALQKERGLRTDAMCKGAKVTPSAISQWRTGLTVASVDKVQQFADFFGVSFVWLFTGIETEKAATPEDDGSADDVILRFLRSLPKERLRGILLALEAPEEVLAALDHEEPRG